MKRPSFWELLNQMSPRKHWVCIGLDTDPAQIPASVIGEDPPGRMFAFNCEIIEATHDVAGGYKLNSAFYERFGSAGLDSLRRTIQAVRAVTPSAPIILDAKRSDIANSSSAYCDYVFGWADCDATTVNPFMGESGILPFLQMQDRGIYVLCRSMPTSRPSIQDLVCEGGDAVYMHVARQALEWNSISGNVGLVVSATSGPEVASIYREAPLPLLVPGIGAQGGNAAEVSAHLKHENQESRVFFAASRSVLYASRGTDFAEAARQAVQSIAAALR